MIDASRSSWENCAMIVPRSTSGLTCAVNITRQRVQGQVSITSNTNATAAAHQYDGMLWWCVRLAGGIHDDDSARLSFRGIEWVLV